VKDIFDKLAHNWRMDDDLTNTVVVDRVGGKHGTGVRNTALMHTAGYNGGALQFNGTSDYIDVGDPLNSIFQNSFSFRVRFRGATDNLLGLCAILDDATGAKLRWAVGDDGQISLTYSPPADEDAVLAASAGTLTADTVTELAAVVEKVSASRIRLYLYKDGELVASADSATEAWGESGIHMGNFNSSANLILGATWNAGATIEDYFDGWQQDFEIYAAALTGDEVARLYAYDSAVKTGTLADCESWAVARLAELTEAGQAIFKTAEQWTNQIGLDGSGTESMDRHAPYAFVLAHFDRVEREGGHDADLVIALEVSFGQADPVSGVARFGSSAKAGVQRLAEHIFHALDNRHPADAGDYPDVACDPFYLTDILPVVDHPKRCGWQMTFQANWIKTH
jgi:hypothetical protein